jgi:F-type H+-transporting ATPase subunit epsilon
MFVLNLYTPDKKLVQNQEVEEIFVSADKGELNILPGHAPLLTTLQPGILRYRIKGQSSLLSVALSWGYCQVNPEGVKILAQTAETPEEIDLERVNRTIKLSTEQLNAIDADAEMVEKHLNKLMRAKVRKELVEQSGQTTH